MQKIHHATPPPRTLYGTRRNRGRGRGRWRGRGRRPRARGRGRGVVLSFDPVIDSEQEDNGVESGDSTDEEEGIRVVRQRTLDFSYEEY